MRIRHPKNTPKVDLLPPDVRRDVMERVARAYLSGLPIGEFMRSWPECPLAHFHVYKLYKLCLARDGDAAPRCRHCSDKPVGHRGVCRVKKLAKSTQSVYKKMIREIAVLDTQYVDGECPCCNQPIDREMLAIDINSNVMSYRGRAWKVQPQLCVFAHVIAQAWPKAVAAEDLIYALYGAQDGPDTAPLILKQYASRLRSVLQDTGMELRRGPRPGSYCLWLPPGGAVAGNRHPPMEVTDEDRPAGNGSCASVDGGIVGEVLEAAARH